MTTIERAPRPTSIDPPPVTVPEAIASLLVAAIAVDGAVGADEAIRIGDVLSTSVSCVRAATDRRRPWPIGRLFS
jgi:hypothetical protein